MTTQGLRRERWSKNKPLLVSKDSSRINGTWTYEFPTVQVSNDRSYWNNACLPFVDLWFTSAICTWCVILPWTPAINLSTIPSINRWADLSFSWLCSVCFCMKSWQLCSKQRMSILTVESCSFLFRMGSGFLREPNSWSTVCKEIYTPHTIGYFFWKGIWNFMDLLPVPIICSLLRKKKVSETFKVALSILTAGANAPISLLVKISPSDLGTQLHGRILIGDIHRYKCHCEYQFDLFRNKGLGEITAYQSLCGDSKDGMHLITFLSAFLLWFSWWYMKNSSQMITKANLAWI